MMDYYWSSLADGTILGDDESFDPASDRLLFDDFDISAADIVLDLSVPGQTTFSYGGKSVTLQVAAASTSSSTFIFYGGGSLIVGDNSTATGADDAGNSLFGGPGDDQLLGLGGDDTLVGGSGDDLFAGGAGEDWADFGGSGPAMVNLAGGIATGDATIFDLLDSIEHVSGSVSNDTLIGDSMANVLRGEGGDDILRGGSNDDTLDGGAGTDTASYSTAGAGVVVDLGAGTASGDISVGTDTLVAIENILGSAHGDVLIGDAGVNHIYGEGGDDTLAGGGGSGNSYLYGGDGFDTADYSGAGTGVVANLGTMINGVTYGAATDHLMSGIEAVVGSAYADDFLHDNGDALLLVGGAGDDVFRVGNSSSVDATFAGGADFDTVDFSQSSGAVSADLGAGTASQGARTYTLSGIEAVIGTTAADTMLGGAQGNRFEGGGGNDSLVGGDGDDTLAGGAGDDVLAGGAGEDWGDFGSSLSAVFVNLASSIATGEATFADTLDLVEHVSGSAQNDTLIGDGMANVLRGEGGDDLLRGGGNDDTLDGGAGTDTASYSTAGAGVVVDLGAGTASGDLSVGTDTLVAIENILGSAHGDVLIGDAGVNHIYGEGGDDTLKGGDGDDTLDGGAGFDVADYSGGGAAGIVVNVALGAVSDDSFGNDTLVDVEGVIGTDYGDQFYNASTTAMRLEGRGGDDWFELGSAGDTVDGGAGTDQLVFTYAVGAVNVDLGAGTGSDGTSTYSLTDIEVLFSPSSGSDTLVGNSAANVLSAADGANWLDGAGGDDTLGGGGGGTDTLIGGAGVDWVLYNDFLGSAVTVDLAAGTASGMYWGTDTLSGIENVLGSNSADQITGDGEANRLDGGSGADLLVGGAGNDTLVGGAGNDTLAGGEGDDSIVGGNNTDTVTYAGVLTGVTVDLAAGTASGGAGSDTLINIEHVTGSAYGDALAGDAAHNALTGGDGDDSLVGNGGDDTLIGGAGVDTMTGGAGDDIYRLAPTAALDAGRIVFFFEDMVDESGGDGADTIYSRSSYALAEGNDIENLVLTGAPMWRAYAGTGNSGANLIRGEGDARHVLDGGGGADTLDGGGGNDVLIWDAADALVDGGAGTDTLRISGAGIALNLSGLAGTKIQNIEVVDLTGTGNNTLTLSLADVLAMSGTTDTLRIDGNAGDAVNGSGWTDGGASGGYRTWTQLAATLLVDTEITASLL